LPTHYDLAGVEMIFFNLGPRALEMLRAPRYLNPALSTSKWIKQRLTHS